MTMTPLAPKQVIAAAELTLLGRLYLECCKELAASTNSPLPDKGIRLRIARSLIKTFDNGEHDPTTIKRIALEAARLYRKAMISLE
jgi:hypothetical protein